MGFGLGHRSYRSSEGVIEDGVEEGRRDSGVLRRSLREREALHSQDISKAARHEEDLTFI